MHKQKDIIVVQKKTNHVEHHKTREILFECFSAHGLTYEVLTLDDIREQKLSYFDPTQKNSGFLPNKKLVIALGGDGTLLHASHHVGGDVRLLGINSAPSSSKGYMCLLKPSEIKEQLPLILSHEHKFKCIQRLQLSFSLSSNDIQKLPLCLNDALICHVHPAATTRVNLFLTDRKTHTTALSQHIYSSGVWVSTVAGQTAAVSSYGFQKADSETDKIFVAIREPYFPKNENVYESTFSFVNADKQLNIVSLMPAGLVCIDGPDSCIYFNTGDTVIFDAPKNGVLKLVL